MSVQNKRNILGVLLIFLLVIPTLTTISWLNFQRKEIKRDVKTKIMLGLSDDELIQLEFEAVDLITLNWKNKHEFEYHGKMYDIVRSATQDSKRIYWCWLDKEETALNSKLDNLLQIALTGNNQRTSKEFQLEWFFKSMIAQTTVLHHTEMDEKAYYLEEIESFYQSIDINITSPPPEVIA